MQSNTRPADLTWHAVHTRPSAEGLAEYHLRRQGYRVFAPWYPVEVIRNRRLVMERRPQFNRYVFIGVGPRQSLAPVNATVGVSTVIYSGDRPLVIPWLVMREMIEAVEFDGLWRDQPADESPSVEIGERRPVLDGAFVDRLAEIAGRVDDSGHVATFIGSLKVSLPVSSLGEPV